MTYTYTPRGVCAHTIEIDLEDGMIQDLRISGGCAGNSQGLVRLATGARAEDVARSLKGVCCGMKQTSCPDQLSSALTEALAAAERTREQDKGEGKPSDDK